MAQKKGQDKKTVILALFGATGDLALKKIFPAFEALYGEGAFAADSSVIGVSRRDWDDEAFLSFLKENKNIDSASFADRISYAKVDIDADVGYEDFAARIAALQKRSPGAETLIYLSLAPQHHPKAISSLARTGVLKRGKAEAKLLIEKPFGTDLGTARALDRQIAGTMDEDRVYRVDHYLGKDTIRAIMDLHESTSDFSRLLTADAVASIRVRMFEEKGIEGRGATYDGVGAFRDVGENHMLEMLAAAVADPGESWQASRARAIESLQPPAETCALHRRGQYAGYGSEKGVRAGSDIETAFEVVTTFHSGKLKGVEIILQAGKKMPVSETSIEVVFKEVSGLPKKMTFKVQPAQEISIENCDASIDSFEIPRTRDAYGNVILDAVAGARRTFVGSTEIEALWSYADRVVACWRTVPLETYSSDGLGKPFLVE
ncbi:MAG: hypothetical protein KGI79_00355 [Patescibacteria group bacterium]|nr:hypothetical protein [Patescibacteria group bacterium]MDE2116319.1 hypothetical protein [Patescibacteria group bacterium]